jgi:hypothetical protein
VTLILERLKELVIKQANKRGLVRQTSPRFVKIRDIIDVEDQTSKFKLKPMKTID